MLISLTVVIIALCIYLISMLYTLNIFSFYFKNLLAVVLTSNFCHFENTITTKVYKRKKANVFFILTLDGSPK